MNPMNINRQWHKTLLFFGAVVLMSLALVGSAHAQATAVEPAPAPSEDTQAVIVPGDEPAPATANCERTIKADVVAFDQVITYNRLGAVNPAGMMYALRRDVKAVDTTRGLVPGNITLKPYKRPRRSRCA